MNINPLSKNIVCIVKYIYFPEKFFQEITNVLRDGMKTAFQ